MERQHVPKFETLKQRAAEEHDPLPFLDVAEKLHDMGVRNQELITELGTDKLTGLLTRNALYTLYDIMVKSGRAERMHEQGYKLQVAMLDLNKLKIHNSLGDHYGGDVAIKAMADRLRELFTYEDDYVGISHPAEPVNVLAGNSLEGGSSVTSRFDAGDEFIVLSMVRPENARRMTSDERVAMQKDRLSEGLSDISITYPLRSQAPDVSGALTYHIATVDGVEIVHTTVSAEFSVVVEDVPTTNEAFRTLLARADGQMMAQK